MLTWTVRFDTSSPVPEMGIIEVSVPALGMSWNWPWYEKVLDVPVEVKTCGLLIWPVGPTIERTCAGVKLATCIWRSKVTLTELTVPLLTRLSEPVETTSWPASWSWKFEARPEVPERTAAWPATLSTTSIV